MVFNVLQSKQGISKLYKGVEILSQETELTKFNLDIPYKLYRASLRAVCAQKSHSCMVISIYAKVLSLFYIDLHEIDFIENNELGKFGKTTSCLEICIIL